MRTVELMRAVTGLADEDEAGVASALEDLVLGVLLQGVDEPLQRRHHSAARPRSSRTSSSLVGEKSSYQRPTA